MKDDNFEIVENFLREIVIMKQFDHHNVLNLHGVCVDDDGFPLIVFPFMPNKDIKTFIKESKYTEDKQLINFMIQVNFKFNCFIFKIFIINFRLLMEWLIWHRKTLCIEIWLQEIFYFQMKTL